MIKSFLFSIERGEAARLSRAHQSGLGEAIKLAVLAPGGSVVRYPPENAGDVRDAGSIPGLGRSPG